MKEEVMQIKDEPEFIIDPSDDDCEDVEDSNEKINNQTDALYNYNTSDQQRCIYCGNIYNKECISIHLRMHSGVKHYKCSWQEENGLECGKWFTQLGHLQRHTTIHSGLKLYKCEVCSKEFSRSDNFRKHMLIHSDIKPYSCEMCSKKFTRPDRLRKHSLTHFKNSC